jgi:hypothetical protein
MSDFAMRVFAFAIGLIPASCHYTVTGPRLWRHTSSAAFDAWVGLWIFAIIFLALCWAEAFKRKKP